MILLDKLDTRTALQKYCPHAPYPRQQAFLERTEKEAFYGGAVAGGKTDALLMAALQYVDIPRYSALILRRDFARLALPGAIMDRGKQWLYSSPAKWNESSKIFRWPNGATLQFGYIDNPTDRFRYASSEFQFIGFDELSEFALGDDEFNPYQFMFSRLRKTTDIPVPLRMRSASNPGNVGHAWVKKQFIPTDWSVNDTRSIIQLNEDRVFVPAKLADNPSVDADEYRKNLANLPEITRHRLEHGDWDVSESKILRREWFKFYRMDRGQIITSHGATDPGHCHRFATIDTAGTSRERAEASTGKGASWSVCAVWDHHRLTDRLYLRHLWRAQVEWGELHRRINEVLKTWNVNSVRIENAHYGQALKDEIKLGNVSLVGPMLPGMQDGYRGAKLERAISARLLSRIEDGRLFLESDAAYVPEYMRELCDWTGLPTEQADQIDVTSYASWECGRGGSVAWGGVLK